MAQDIDLSPRKILNYMRDLEVKLPRRKYVEFDAQSVKSVNSDEELNQAATKMLHFVGLDGYVPQCEFCQTQDGIGGYTYVDRKDNVIPISVSEKYRGKTTVVLAVLAHEICHKVIYINGINYQEPFQMMNEVFTDICTIYVGFGNLVLNGYISSDQKQTSYLGYLKFHVYKDTYDIAKQIMAGCAKSEPLGNDIFLEEAFKMWHRDVDKRQGFLKAFVDTQDEFSRLTRDANLLIQILNQIKESYAPVLDKADESFFRRGDFFDRETKELLRPIGAFSAIYENILSKDRQEQLENYDNIVTNTMCRLIDNCRDIQVSALKYQPFECPFCHTKSSNASYDNRKLSVKCPSCNKHFHLNCEHWNYTIELGRLKRLAKEESDKLIAKGRESGDSAGYQRGLSDGKRIAVSDFLNSLPKWLRWIVGKYK